MNSSMQQLVQIPDDKGVHIKSAGVKGEKYVYKFHSPRREPGCIPCSRNRRP